MESPMPPKSVNIPRKRMKVSDAGILPCYHLLSFRRDSLGVFLNLRDSAFQSLQRGIEGHIVSGCCIPQLGDLSFEFYYGRRELALALNRLVLHRLNLLPGASAYDGYCRYQTGTAQN